MTDKGPVVQPTTAQALPAADITRFRDAIRGEIILSGDTNYDAMRQVHNLLRDGRPALIVRPVDSDDVVHAVRFASDLGLTVAVRGGGHSGGGFGTVDGGIVIDLSLMRAISVDPDARIARAQGGITAGEYTAVTMTHGLITPFGDSPSVGIGGLTLGGGIGWLGRKLGMTIDSLLAVELVTADGRKLHVNETEHPDLFWAIRGGGGNFGIVTSFEFRLYPIDTVLGGALYLPPTRDVMRGVIDLARQAPDELTTISLVMHVLPSPELPEALHGQLAVIVMLVWAGDLEAGQRALSPFRALAKPMADLVRPMPFSAMYEMFAAAGEPVTSITRAFMADSLDDVAIDAMLASLEQTRLPSSSSITVIQLRILGGAIARIPVDATAFAHRDANLMVAIAALGFEPVELDDQQARLESVFAAVRHVSTGAYLNFLDDEGEIRIREAYPESTYRRLAEVKRRYDPDNSFHLNQNVRPAEA
jgi:FAD/FMN-containing dehydrogenase